MHLIEVSGFGGNAAHAFGFINLDLTVGLTRAATIFHVIDAHTSYHLLMGRLWIYHHKVVLSTYHQCPKAISKGKIAHINASAFPFE